MTEIKVPSFKHPLSPHIVLIPSEEFKIYNTRTGRRLGSKKTISSDGKEIITSRITLPNTSKGGQGSVTKEKFCYECLTGKSTSEKIRRKDRTKEDYSLDNLTIETEVKRKEILNETLLSKFKDMEDRISILEALIKAKDTPLKLEPITEKDN